MSEAQVRKSHPPPSRMGWPSALLLCSLPWAAFLTLPPAWVAGYSWLYRLIAPFAPRDRTWSDLGTGCMGQPLGDVHQRGYQLLLDMGEGEFVLVVAMAFLALLSAALIALDLGARKVPTVTPSWTMCVVVGTVLGWATFARAAFELVTP